MKKPPLSRANKAFFLVLLPVILCLAILSYWMLKPTRPLPPGIHSDTLISSALAATRAFLFWDKDGPQHPRLLSNLYLPEAKRQALDIITEYHPRFAESKYYKQGFETNQIRLLPDKNTASSATTLTVGQLVRCKNGKTQPELFNTPIEVYLQFVRNPDSKQQHQYPLVVKTMELKLQ